MISDQTVAVLKALADPTRLNLVRRLAHEPASRQSCGRLSARACLSQPAMSHHFAKLVNAGVVLESKSGKEKNYQLNRQLLIKCGLVPERL
ncbi:MAG TPA: metalloregulator ArsR/SmtB family transcription factor [Candidatus Saccharimonadales bacterium]|nr:metalloregulator ArsR/SmtB family transcription factor [Candidatus Saccharimonadales bacterium]